MKSEEIENLIPRKSDEHLQVVLNKYSDFIEELVNLGGQIIIWDVEKKREGKDNHLPTVFLRNLIELADSLSILVRKSSIEPSKILTRSMLENSLNLLYMIEKEEKKRSSCYLIWKTNKEINYFKQFLSNSDSHTVLKKSLKKEGNENVLKGATDNNLVKNILHNKSLILKQPEFKAIQKEYYRKKGKRKSVKNWYNLYDGPQNFFELCKYFNKVLIYEFFYREYSENVHSVNILKGFVSAESKGQAQIIQIRDFQDAERVFNTIGVIILETYSNYVKQRLPEKSSLYLNDHLSLDLKFKELNKIKINYKR